MLVDTVKYPIVVSAAYYSLFLASGSVLRRLVRQHVSEDWQQFFLFLVTTFSVLGCSLENGHIRAQYGRVAYVIVIYLLSLWYSFTIFDSSPNPISNIINFSRGRYSFKLVLWLTVAQICGTILAYRSAHVFWSFDLCEHHYQRFREEMCLTSLQVSVPTGLFIESVGTAFNVLMNLIVFNKNRIGLEVAVKNLIMCLLTVAVINTTGFYLNPLNASNQSLGCQGTSTADHFLVYWIGPCVSAYLAAAIFYRLRKAYREQKAVASVEEKVKTPAPVDQQQRVSSSDKQQSVSSSDEQKRASSSDEQQRVSSSDKQWASTYDQQQRESSSGKQQRESSSDRQQRESSSGKQQRESSSDKKQRESSSDKKQRESSSDKKQRESSSDKQQRESSSDKNQRESSSERKQILSTLLDLPQSKRNDEIRQSKNNKPGKLKKL